jgi:hypothetical protein
MIGDGYRTADPGPGSHWECPVCGRVEWEPAGSGTPQCAGTPEGQHATTPTRKVTSANPQSTDRRRWFCFL